MYFSSIYLLKYYITKKNIVNVVGSSTGILGLYGFYFSHMFMAFDHFSITTLPKYIHKIAQFVIYLISINLVYKFRNEVFGYDNDYISNLSHMVGFISSILLFYIFFKL